MLDSSDLQQQQIVSNLLKAKSMIDLNHKETYYHILLDTVLSHLSSLCSKNNQRLEKFLK